MQPGRSIFRSSALQQYVQRQERDVLPRLLSPAVFLFYWVLLALLFAAGCVAWWGEIPLYETGSGMLITETEYISPEQQYPLALVFLPADRPLALRIGMPMQVQLDAASPRLDARIVWINPEVMGPDAVRKRYALDMASSRLVSRPSWVLVVDINGRLPAQEFAGSTLSAYIHTGSQRIISLLPGLSDLVGGKL